MKNLFYSLTCCLIGGMITSCGGAKKSDTTEEDAEPATAMLSYSKSLKAPETDRKSVV